MKRKHLKKKIGSLVLAAAMIITSFPAFSEEVQAAEASEPSQFVTKEQLKTFNTDDTDAAGENPAKVYFGKNNGNNQEWWIAGCQGGDSVTLFAASPLATNQNFEYYTGSNSTKTYSSDWNCSYSGSAPSDVNANHYGGSPLRTTLKELETSCFSTVEQALMQETTIYTNDTKNSSVYSTTDKLYLAHGETNVTYITVGENASNNLNNGLHIDKEYWVSEDSWLRTPGSGAANVRMIQKQYSEITNCLASKANQHAVVPAFELNLSSVLFASAAKAASSKTATKGKITADAAMTLRLDGTGKAIGTASYDATAGLVVAQKDAGAAGTVSLVVQGNDGTGDWYYSVQAGEATFVTKEQIQTACGISGVDLAKCKIWLETPAENGSLAYARMAETKTIKMIDTVALTGVKPAGGSAFPAKASCSTEGIDANSLVIAYTDKDSSAAATGTADWNTAYQAKLTLAVTGSGSAVYLFGDSVSVTVDGETAQNVKLNDDGTLTVTKEFTTARRKITGIRVPTVPSSNVFAKYYTAENVLSNTNSELGKTATLTLEGSTSPNTVNADVAWTLANSGSTAYNAAAGAGNTFRWTITAAKIKDYDASGCIGYDSGTGTISGTVAISNKAAMPVTIDGDNQTLTYDGSTIDVSQYFTIDANAGIGSYALVPGTGVTGQGSLSGAVLTVTKPGVFQVKLTTAVNGNYAAGEKTITLTINYSSGEVILESGKTVVREDETVKNDSNGMVTIDKGNDGTVDVTVKLPQAGSVNIDAEGKVTVPANGTVQATGGKELTLPEGGTVDKDGNVEAEKIVSGDVTVTAPSGGKVTADKAGSITVPAGGMVQTEDGNEITLPNGGTVDKDGIVEAEKIISGDITVTAPEGGKVTADKAGNITVPAGGTVQTGDGEEITLPDGGMVDADGNIIEQCFDGSGTPEDPYQIKSEEDLIKLAELVNSGKDAKKACYKIEAEEGITLTAGSSPWTPVGTAEHPFTGTFDGNGKTIKGLEISGDEPKDDQGLFGVNAGTIKNLTIEGSVTGKDNVGGIAGTNEGTITGCTNKGSVTGKANVGGIVGTNGENGKVKDNVNNGNVVGDITGSGSSTIGALIGKNDNTNVAGDITGNYYQKTDGINKDLTGIGGTEQDPAGITSGSSPTPGEVTPSPTPGESTPSPTPGGATPSPTPGGSTPSPTPGGTTPSPTPGESTPSPAPGGATPSPAPGGSTPSPAPEQQERVNQIAKELNVPVETAKKLQEMAQQLGIETDTLLLTDQDIVNQTSEGDAKGTTFSKLQAKAVKAKKNSITVKWTKVKGAGGYQIYAAKCGKNSKYKLVKTIKKAGTTSFTYKKLKKGTGYRFIVRAYKDVDGKKYTVAASKAVHEVTEGGTRTNPKSIKVNKGTVKMKVRKKFTIKSKIVKANSGKKLSNHRKLSYESTNKEVAAVSKKGVIQGRKAGTCYIYVYAENGIFKKIKVTVKK